MQHIEICYEALGVKNIDQVLVKPQQPMPKDPALEHIDSLAVQDHSKLFPVKITELILLHI
jgi:hypothetical protein